MYTRAFEMSASFGDLPMLSGSSGSAGFFLAGLAFSFGGQ